MMYVGTRQYRDSDGRKYTVRFHRTLFGRYRAYAAHIPWPGRRVEKFFTYQRHLYPNGEICLSAGPIRDLATAEQRAALWCEAFSYLMEHGYKATCRALPEWG